MEFKTITPGIIRNNLLDLSQVVFEVTSSCNFRCEYCSFGKLYLQDDNQSYKKEFLSFTKAKALIDYLISGWTTHMPPTQNQEVYFSFFGGEPLLNMKLISRIVAYIESFSNLNRKFIFSMTTNGWLLDKYQDYLVEKDFRLLISLDGDRFENSYRVSAGGKQTHEKVLQNIFLLRDSHPEFFKKRVLFNAVIHNRNSLSSVTRYFIDTFGKTPQISPLADANINPEYLSEFNIMRQNVDDLERLDDDTKQMILKEQFFNIPIVHDIIRDYFLNSGNVFRSYNELVFGTDSKSFQTGTCTPFSKKIFLRTNGEILPCERIPSKFTLGKIIGHKVVLDENKISSMYDLWMRRLLQQCRNCARNKTCNQCIFQIDNFPNNSTCNGFLSAQKYNQLRKRYFAILGKHPELYKTIFEKVILL